MSLSAHFLDQADACARMGSPFMQALLAGLFKRLDNSTKTGSRLLNWQGDVRGDVPALRLAGALHALVLDEKDPQLAACYPPNPLEEANLLCAVQKAIERHDEWICHQLDNAPQTNEVARSAILLPGFLWLAKCFRLPMDIYEIGASAGLNLNFDRYQYRYGQRYWGEETSQVLLSPKIAGLAPSLDGRLAITGRRGCDLSPLDSANPQDRLRLRSYVWPDQTERLARLDNAIAIARHSLPRLEAIDAGDFVEKMLANRQSGRLTVLFHSVVWQYLPQASQARIQSLLEEAGKVDDAPLAWLRMEGVGGTERCARLLVSTWPDHQTAHLAKCDFHGRWIEWLGKS